MPVIAGFAIALSAAVSNGAAVAPQTQPTVAITLPAAMPQSQSVEQYIREYFSDEPVMIEIAKCESRFRQYGQDGHVLRNGSGSSAVGVFQVMGSIHAKFADDKLGLDIYSLQGNAAYARYLYDREGTMPWAASAGCWNKSGKLLARAQ
ncbi:MAG: hypothetical protein JWL87_344 [Candidatus Adlerbacteria bacterium]|nr:hypothetical protein [Candidatus Adlerbacteria bacterium]